MRTAIYARISEDSNGDAAGVARQIEDCKALVAQHPSWVLAGTYVDNDVSALTGKNRPQYNALMQAVVAGAVQTVVVYMLSRVWRNRRERAEGIEKLQAVRGRIICVRGPDLDMSNASGRMLAGILGEVDTAESEVKAERISRAHKQRAESGAYHGPRPFGYQTAWTDDPTGRLRKIRGLEIDPAEAEILRGAARRILRGDSLRSVARDWAEAGIVSTRGAAIAPEKIRAMLLRPLNVGIRTHHPRDYAGQRGDPADYSAAWEPILDRDVWDTVCSVLLDGGRRTNPGTARTNLLIGYLICGKCGAVMRGTGRGREHKKRYVCPVAPLGCGRIGRMRDPVEDLVRDCLFHWLDNGAYDQAVDASAASDEAEEALVERRTTLRGRLRAYDRDYADGVVTGREMKAAKARVEPELAQVETELQERRARRMLAVVPERGTALRAAWQSWGLDRRRLLLGLLVDRVVVHPTRTGSRKFDPSAVQVLPGDWAAAADPALVTVPISRLRTQAERVADYIADHPGTEITAPEIGAAFNIDPTVAWQLLRKLTRDGLLCQTATGTGPGNPNRYRPAA